MQYNERKLSADERKQKIRDRYKSARTANIEVIPAKEVVCLEDNTSIKRVAAYVRVSTDNDEQVSSYELQKNYYTEYISTHPGWELAGIYKDEGITGTSIEHRKGVQQMVEDAKAGRIDLIITKSIARFARNIVDCLSIVEELKNLNPPVGIKFEADNIYTLDSSGRMILTVLASVAEEESHSKSIIMNWSIDKRFSRGLFLTPSLLGYDRNENGNLVINPDEAETVKVIYYLFLNGYTYKEIAELLTKYERETKLGNTKWRASTIRSVIVNERHCGDILARKTYTPNFLNHKAKKNHNNRTQYRQEDHHEAIVSREVFDAAKHMQSLSSRRRNRSFPSLCVINEGRLKGYIPIDKDWTGYSVDEYRKATESVLVNETATPEITEQESVGKMEKCLDLSGYKVVRAQFFSDPQRMSMTISNGHLNFSKSCLKKFDHVEFVEFLLNPIEKCVAIRPCNADNPYAIHWGKLKEERWMTNRVSCRGIEGTLSSMLDWEADTKYRFTGNYFADEDSRMLLFQLDEPEMIKVQEVMVPVEPEEENHKLITKAVKKRLFIFEHDSEQIYGWPAMSPCRINVAEQQHYAGNWNILCPAKVVDGLNVFTADTLGDLLVEANKIIEGWVT